jgi:adhesin/invasin
VIVSRLPFSFALALPLVFAACGGDGLTLPPEGEAAHIVVIDGDDQSGRVGSVLGKPLLVRVTDTRDRPVAGATVNFSFASQGAGVATPASTTTDSDGRASSSLTLGSVPGTITGKAEVPVDAGITPVEAAFTATAVSDDANGIAYVSGDGQSAPVNSTLPAPLVVQVTDQFGNPISGVTISWTANDGGSVSASSTVTDGNGQTSVTRTLGGNAGQQTTTALADGLAGSPVTFTHTATAGSATGVLKVSGDNQSALVGTALANPLVVQVLDALGNPIPNRAVTWVTGDGSVNPENTTTDAQGHASTSWTLGPTPGPKTANAVVSGVGNATFNAIATAGSPSGSTSTVSASPTTITAGGTSTITVTVRDDSNNPVSGVTVTVSASGSGNSIDPVSASSGDNGVATFTFSSTVAEAKAITATAGGVAIADGATITVQKGSSTVEITSDDPDPSTAGEPVTVEVTVSGNGGPPTGDVVITINGGLPTETCTVTLSNGSGSCILPVTLPGTGSGNRRVITATYGGDTRFSGDTDTENHRVDPLPVGNNPPTAAFTAPTDCVAGQPCQFTDGSTDSDGSIQSRLWEFQDGSPATSTEPNPSVTFASEGSKTVTLTVTDNDGAPDTETKTVNVAPAPQQNQAPVAGNDAYTTPGAGQPLTVLAPGVLANDADPDVGDVVSAQNGSDPAQGSLSLNSDGAFTYTPDVGASGTDTFTYEASDGSLTTQATVTITIAP